MVKKHRSIGVGDATIEYEVRRSRRRRKTIRMVVHEGKVLVTAPMRTPNSVLQAFVQNHGTWILEQLSREPPEVALKRFCSGDTLPYLGRNIRIVVEQAAVRSAEVRFDHWRFRIAAPKTPAEQEGHRVIGDAIIEWYRRRAAERLSATVGLWQRRLGLQEKPRVLIGNQRRRWGSCAFDGTLRFNWRLVMLKPALSEYVVVHELAHLTHRNHSKEFWGLVSKLLPDVTQLRAELREQERALPL